MNGAAIRTGAWRVLAVEGPDAADFLHRLTTQSVRSMNGAPCTVHRVPCTDCGGAHVAWLDPKGRVLSLFVAARLSAESFRLIIPAAIFEKTASLAERYHFSEKLTLAESSEEACFAVGQVGAYGHTPLQNAAWHWRDPLYGDMEAWWALFPKGKTPQAANMGEDEWDALRIAHSVPEYGRDVDENTVALEAVAYAIARGKGCYPGQEIVERIFTQGNVARRLAALSADGEVPVAVGDAVISDGKKIGKITSAVFSNSAQCTVHGAPRMLALAYLDRGFWNGEKSLSVEKGGVPYPLRVLP